MRRFLEILLLSTLSVPAFAADSPKVDALPRHHVRMTWEKHFTRANLAHDGHLTMAEANGGYGLVARHFGEIDADHKGYVTENDIKAWHTSRRTIHRQKTGPASPRKRRSAMQPAPAAPGPVAVSVAGTAAMPLDLPPVHDGGSK